MIHRLTQAKALILLISFFVVNGCSTLSIDSEAIIQSWEQHAQQLSAQQHWTIKGKIGIRQNNKYHSASLNWTQQQQQYQIFMSGPLGSSAVNIEGSAHGVMMKISGEGSYFALTPEALLEDRLGWSLPISNLHYWIKGLPAPDTPYQFQLNDQDRLASLQQDNWNIDYRSYQPTQAAYLPRKLVLKRGEDIKVTLVIKKWSFYPTSGQGSG